MVEKYFYKYIKNVKNILIQLLILLYEISYYEAASRGAYGEAVAEKFGYLKERFDMLVKGDSRGASEADLRANARGRAGAKAGKSLRETCPTHHTKYK